jgi:hypothetical protein
VPAYVPKRRSTEQGIGDRMQQHIGIRMTEQAMRVLNAHTAQYERAAFNQGMDIPAFTHSKCG